MSDPDLRLELSEKAPGLWSAISEIAKRCIPTILENLSLKSSRERFPKTLHDPVWGTIELYPWEIAILDSFLLQRLRGISQLGLASYVYTGASHSRLEHTLGVVETSQRMMTALDRNAENHRNFGRDKDPNVPPIDEIDRHSIRLAALLHDIGHGPYSHVTEPLLVECMPEEFKAAEDVFRRFFPDITKVAPSETIAAALVMSDEMMGVFLHPHFEAVRQPHRLALSITCRILGSRHHLSAGYLSGIISGPLDADKVDYMARDSHHSGFPVGLDFNRLISKLEVIVITEENATNEELRSRAREAGGRCYEMGISLSGLGAYEQMIMGRALLYDRLYYHHKVRAAEEMLRHLVRAATYEAGRQQSLYSYFDLMAETEYASIWSGVLRSDLIPSGGEASRRLGDALFSRRIYNRAAAIAARFIGGLDGLPEQEGRDTRQLQWDSLIQDLRTGVGSRRFGKDIYDIAIAVGASIPELRSVAATLQLEHILVDFPTNKAKLGRGNDILTRTEAGRVVPPNLFFDAEKWSLAYEQQKLVGHVFTTLEKIPLVALATRIALYEHFGVVMTSDAENACKTTGLVKPEWIRVAGEKGLCSAECAEVLALEKPTLIRLRPEHLILPSDLTTDDPDLPRRIADGMRKALPTGLPAGVHKALVDSIRDLLSFANMAEQTGLFVNDPLLSEAMLQMRLKQHLTSRQVPTKEGLEVGAGETDLILYDRIVVENKVRGETAHPIDLTRDAVYQARRYSIALAQRVVFIVTAYKPRTESAILPISQRLTLSAIENVPEEHARIGLLIPWGFGSPSKARAPG